MTTNPGPYALSPERQRLRDTVDAAVLAHRADPNPTTRAALGAAAAASHEAFLREQTVEFMHRTGVRQ